MRQFFLNLAHLVNLVHLLLLNAALQASGSRAPGAIIGSIRLADPALMSSADLGSLAGCRELQRRVLPPLTVNGVFY
ncbi:hypothetical protein PBY51_018387 [Eleginops maclovinus]|uniref:Secreted protein n=1 Tax=Eleginops maclovinus TaxID=56733 RepID=A0AAN7Y7E2_ELEMC|nr:hypothetical protein PBY51_018387 [Eleginops maclovinus]